MKKNVFVFGSIAGLIIAVFMMVSMAFMAKDPNFDMGMVIGYTSMLVAFSFVFIGIKNFRDKYNNGVITFGKAFKVGFFISLIASTIYVLTWLVEYYLFIPDFMEKYADHMLKQAQESGASAAEIAKKTEQMAGYKEMYKNPIFVILLTYSEILPVGLLVTLISALILKRKQTKSQNIATS